MTKQVSSIAAYFDVANRPNIGNAANGQDQILVGTPEPATILLVLFAFLVTFGYYQGLKPRLARVVTKSR